MTRPAPTGPALAEGLADAANLIGAALALQRQINSVQLSKQGRMAWEILTKKRSKMLTHRIELISTAILSALFIAFLAFILLAGGSIGAEGIYTLVCAFLSIFLDSFIIGMILAPILGPMLRRREQPIYNEAYGAYLQQVTPFRQRLAQVQRAYADRVAPWYPPEYSSVEASSFMGKAVRQGRANTLGEAINLYENHMHQARVEQQQETANFLASEQLMATYLAGSDISDAVDRNTEAVKTHSGTTKIYENYDIHI
ncbi:hypothetical protein [Bifidobacterium sp. ESL0745]|uniref:hypothetical protein n=1 Tax=Bifidobacterium sp. ESL0745 TaxID=2983226 RepID=UPI0023F878AC|nr:hypothetical protein [Bifidobacterium sp. ESL0745]MDF7665914.1 hypothetical protein [Bifidobacterium sp. ESL0745]